MVKRYATAALAAALCLFAASSAVAEGALSMELGISNLLLKTREIETTTSAPVELVGGDSYLGWLTTASAGLSYKSRGNKNVRADVAFSLSAPGTLMMPLISLERAYLKARFPWFRVTAGKTRLGWGDGFIFNSGDVIFGSTDTAVDLTAAEVRSETEWLTALNIPLGRFSFIEGVILAPEADSAGGFPIGRIDHSSGGGRLYTKLAGIKIEGGYFFDQMSGSAPLHKPYIGLQGNLLVDWNISASTALPASGEIEDPFKDSFNLSAGLFHMVSLNSISMLTFRLEGLYRPFMGWEEETRASGDEPPVYALLLYPEISYSPIDTINISTRTIWSPVDNSALITAGAGWNVFEGFDLNFFALFNAGDPDDNFSWDKSEELWSAGEDSVDGLAFMIGVNYIY